MAGRKHVRGQGTVTKRGKWWHVCYSIKGQTFRESAGTQDREEALAYLRRKLGMLASGDIVSINRVRISDLLNLLNEDYESNERASAYIAKLKIDKYLLPFFGSTLAAKLTSTFIQSYVKSRKQDGAKPGTINRELGFLRRAFQLGALADPPLVARVPNFPKLPEDNVRTGYLNPDEYKRLLAELPDELKLLFVLAYHVGMRKTALLNLKWKQVDFEGGLIRTELPRSRNRKPLPVAVPIYGDMWEYLEKQEKSGPFIFTRGPNRIKDFRASWTKACIRAGLPKLLFHDLRRTAVRNLRKAKVPETTAMKISGHKTRSMLDRYSIHDDADFLEAGELAEKLHKQLHKA